MKNYILILAAIIGAMAFFAAGCGNKENNISVKSIGRILLRLCQ